LFILKQMMTDMKRESMGNEVPDILRPCDFFDVIGGISTGG